MIDEENGEAQAIDAALSIPSVREVRVLYELVALPGPPRPVRVDNAPDLISDAFMTSCGERGIEMRHIQPGKPDQNAFVEGFNRSYRREALDAYVFESIDEVRRATDEWLEDYNHQRPHDSLSRVPPITFKPRPYDPPTSSYRVST